VSTGRHPSDADREEAAAPVVDRVVAAIEAGDAGALAACYAEGCVCLVDGARIAGREAVAAHLAERMSASGPRRVTRRQQHGAHAVVAWEGAGDGLCVLEIRRGEIVFEAAAAR
jgi:ketosteroid isomerase-like protein